MINYRIKELKTERYCQRTTYKNKMFQVNRKVFFVFFTLNYYFCKQFTRRGALT